MVGSQRPVVSVIPLQDGITGRRVLLQQRNKANDDTPYRGFLELPQGKVAEHESVSTFASYKLESETGLHVVKYRVIETSNEHKTVSSHLHSSRPFCCVVDTIQNHFAVAVVALVEGETRQTRDAKGHQWLGVTGLQKALSEGAIFPLNIPMLELLLEYKNDFGLDQGRRLKIGEAQAALP